MKCEECYSEDPRITPLMGAKECLENHKQYICSKCGRIVCIDVKGEKRARCFMPFKSKAVALLYLKCAEIISEKLCGIYELIYKRGDRRYRIFETETELNEFLKRNKDVKCENKNPVHINKKYNKTSKDQVRFLKKEEVEKYLKERKESGIKD
jgi:hypothetical protein